MQTPQFFEQITGGIASPDTLNQWLRAVVPSGANGNELFTQPSAALLASIQSVLKGTDVLRHMQLEAIQNARKRTSQLAESLAHATGPMDAGNAWQQFSRDNLQNSMEYWTAYREIVQDTEIKVLSDAENLIIKKAEDAKLQARLVKPVRKGSATKARTPRRNSVSH